MDDYFHSYCNQMTGLLITCVLLSIQIDSIYCIQLSEIREFTNMTSSEEKKSRL